MLSPKRKYSLLILLLGCSLLLSGCLSSLLSKQSPQNFNEQLYIDARLGFAVKHPLDWQRLQIPVSSPQYRADTVRWRIKDPEQKNHDAGEMLIRSRPADPRVSLPDLLSSYLSSKPELKTSQVESFNHPSGPALKLLGHDDKLGRLAIALKGQKRDFIISLEFPSDHFEELLPIFQDIINTFVEVVKPATPQ